MKKEKMSCLLLSLKRFEVFVPASTTKINPNSKCFPGLPKIYPDQASQKRAQHVAPLREIPLCPYDFGWGVPGPFCLCLFCFYSDF
jgi:hypothetical protein